MLAGWMKPIWAWRLPGRPWVSMRVVARGLKAAQLPVDVAHLQSQVVQAGAAALDEAVDDILVLPGASGATLHLTGFRVGIVGAKVLEKLEFAVSYGDEGDPDAPDQFRALGAVGHAVLVRGERLDNLGHFPRPSGCFPPSSPGGG